MKKIGPYCMAVLYGARISKLSSLDEVRFVVLQHLRQSMIKHAKPGPWPSWPSFGPSFGRPKHLDFE